MKSFFRKIESLWKKPFSPVLLRYRGWFLLIGLILDVFILFRGIIGNIVYDGMRALFTNVPLRRMTFELNDIINEISDYHYYSTAIIILFACYVAGNVTGWIVFEKEAQIKVFDIKNAFIERLLSSSPVGAVMTDEHGEVTYTNSEAHKLFSSDDSESVVGRRLSDLDLIANTILIETVDKMQNSYAGIFQKEIAFKKTSKSDIEWFNCIFSPVSLDGVKIGNIGWINDTTEQKKKQEAVIHSIILALTKAIDAKDKKTQEHSMRVKNISFSIARYLNLTPEKYPTLEYAALLHDVGKILLPDEIVQEKIKLDDEQKTIIFRLPEYSASFLDGIEELQEVREIVYYQKEWFIPPKDDISNFKPFPGLRRGEAIPIESRIIAVADAFESMISEKAYKKAMKKDIALIEFKRSSGIKPSEDEINRLLAHYKKTRKKSMTLDELLTHSRIERQFDYKIVRALEQAVINGEI